MKSLDEVVITNRDLETAGIVIDYGLAQFRLARAGGANKTFLKSLEMRTRPYRRAIDQGMFPTDMLEAIMVDVFVDAVLLGWGSPATDEGGGPNLIRLKDGTWLTYSKDAARDYFKARPDLFRDLLEQAQKAGNYRNDDVEAEAKK